MSKYKESVFVTSGYNNWKDGSFDLHCKSSCHRVAVLKWEHHCRGIDIGRQLQRQLTATQAEAFERSLPPLNIWLDRHRGHQEE